MSILSRKKLDINELKRTAIKGSKCRTVSVKYETVLPYFKGKDTNSQQVFQVGFAPLLVDLLDLLLACELVCKMESESKEPLRSLEFEGEIVRLEAFPLKVASSQDYPIKEVCDCLALSKDSHTKKKALFVLPNKLMSFYKSLRLIYSDFCSCSGEKLLVEDYEFKALYEAFKCSWSKHFEKGKATETEKIQKKICRTLYFFGILVENHIFNEIEVSMRHQKEELLEFGTKSEKKRNINDVAEHVVSSTYSFGSNDLFSNVSIPAKSHRSIHNELPQKTTNGDYEKSEKIMNRTVSLNLWDKIEIKTIKFRLFVEEKQIGEEDDEYIPPSRHELNLLSNDVENIYILHAFNIQKFKDSCIQAEQINPQFFASAYSPNGHPYYYNPAPVPMQNYPGYGVVPIISPPMHPGFNYVYAQRPMPMFVTSPTFESEVRNNQNASETNNNHNTNNAIINNNNSELFQLRRSFDLYNFEIKKNPHRTGSRKIN